jgi:hypothetical protein
MTRCRRRDDDNTTNNNYHQTQRDLHRALDEGARLVDSLGGRKGGGPASSNALPPTLSSSASLTSPASPASPASVALTVAARSKWATRHDMDGNLYYENLQTGETQWEVPPELSLTPGVEVEPPEQHNQQQHEGWTHNISGIGSGGTVSGSGADEEALRVIEEGRELRQDDSIASILADAQRYAHFGASAMGQVLEVDNLVLTDNTVVKVGKDGSLSCLSMPCQQHRTCSCS